MVSTIIAVLWLKKYINNAIETAVNHYAMLAETIMYRVFINWIRNNLGFSRTEANGYLVLIFLLMIVHFGVQHLPVTKTLQLELEDNEFLDSLSMILSTGPPAGNDRPAVLRPFNPNSVSYDSLVAMGIPSQVAANILKYRNAGGRYDQPEDLRKIYGMNDSIWQHLIPWIDLVPQPVRSVEADSLPIFRSEAGENQQPAKLHDINNADSAWFKGIYGIGPVLSKRIVKYRDLLGGFYSFDQLNEVYGLSPEVIENIRERTVLHPDSNALNKININKGDYSQFASHPYFSYNQAKAIVSYREQHGPFNSMEGLKKIHLIDDSTYLRVSPYLDF